MVQAVPEKIVGEITETDDWQRVQMFLETLEPFELLDTDVSAESVLWRLFHEDEVRVQPSRVLKFQCTCHEGKVRYALRKQKAVRWYRRAVTVGDVEMETAEHMLREADSSPEEADAIYRLSALCPFEERFVIPPMHREEAIEMAADPLEHKHSTGFGFLSGPWRSM